MLPPLQLCRLLRGGVDWNSSSSLIAFASAGRLLRGGVDWNSFVSVFLAVSFLSPPSRRRGLKSLKQPHLTPIPVASFAEAWIEMLYLRLYHPLVEVASFAEAWIEIKVGIADFRICKSPPSRRRGLKLLCLRSSGTSQSRLLRGGVDWNKLFITFSKSVFSRLLRGGVDWNCGCRNCCKTYNVASFAEAWIEIIYRDTYDISD